MCILVSYLQHANWTTLCDCTIFLRMCSLNHYDRVLNNNSKGLQRLAVCPPYSKNHAVRYSSNLFGLARCCAPQCAGNAAASAERSKLLKRTSRKEGRANLSAFQRKSSPAGHAESGDGRTRCSPNTTFRFMLRVDFYFEINSN